MTPVHYVHPDEPEETACGIFANRLCADAGDYTSELDDVTCAACLADLAPRCLNCADTGRLSDDVPCRCTSAPKASAEK